MNLVCSKCGAQLNTAGNCIAGCGSPAIGTNCGWCGRGLPGGAPPLADRIAALEAELAERTQERDGVAANLANTQIMFEDWKVVHSTVALEVALVRERERREAAEALLRDIAARSDNFDENIDDHFYRYKD